MLAIVLIPIARNALRTPPDSPPFDGDSSALRRTTVVATLDTPIEPGKNAVWCSAWPLAWKTLAADVAGEPLKIAGGLPIADRLNAAPDPSPDLPPGAAYAAAGWVDRGILQTIARDFKAAFPDAASPTFPAVAPDGCVAYAYVHAAVAFPLPYFEDRNPLAFTDAAGRRTGVRAFGVRAEDDYAYRALRLQPKLLYVNEDDSFHPTEFAIDLCRTSEPVQVVVAVLARRGDTLADTLDALDRRIATPHTDPHVRDGLGINDTLLVPKIACRILHRFRELEGRHFQNSTMPRGPIDLATQEIQFRLDRGGMELTAEAKHHMRPIPTDYRVDRPFLVYARKRGAARPFLALWIDNDELLTRTGERPD